MNIVCLDMEEEFWYRKSGLRLRKRRESRN